MSALFTIYDPKGEVFEVPAHRLPSLKKKGWTTKAPVAAAPVSRKTKVIAPAPVAETVKTEEEKTEAAK